MTDGTPSRRQAGSGLRVLFSLAAAVVVVAGLKLAAQIFVPVMLGLFFALLSLPVLNWLVARRVPHALAVLATVLIDLLFLSVVAFLLSGVVGNLQSKSGEYAERLRFQAVEFSTTMDREIQRLGGFWRRSVAPRGESSAAEGPKAPDAGAERRPAEPQVGPAGDPTGPTGEQQNSQEMAVVLDTSLPTFRELFERYWDSNRVVATFGRVDFVGRFASIASKSVFALIVMIFILAESSRFVSKVDEVRQARGPDLYPFQRTSRDIQKYLGIKTAASVVTGFLAAISCYFFKLDFPLLWGLVAFLFNYVPVIGSIVAAVPAVILALILHGFWPAAGVLSCYLVINFTIGNFLEPIFMGERFGLSTIVVILSVLFWGFVWGPVGMLLAVPLTMVLKVMLASSNDFRWISALMGKGHAEALAEAAPSLPPGPGREGETGGPAAT